MEQVQVQVKAQAQQEEDAQIVCEIFYNQALLNMGPIQQTQEMAGPDFNLLEW